MSNILYLHGFASGPRSAKGRWFHTRFAQIGAEVHQPDLAEGDFRTLTITKQLKLIDRLVRELEPALVIGSSLGGYLAALHASMVPQAAPPLVLLAPAFGFPQHWADGLGEQKMLEWRKTGSIDVYHYGLGSIQPLGYQLYEDGLWFDEFPVVTQPTLIFQGRRDEQVDPQRSVEYSRGKPNVELELLDSDHSLTDVLEPIWDRTAAFYQQLEPLRPGGA